jgi:hypothetical protein
VKRSGVCLHGREYTLEGYNPPATLRASVASRQEEKQRHRQERLAREQAEKKAAARRKRLQYVFGGLLAVGAVAGVVLFLVVGVGGGDGDGGAGEPSGPSDAAASVELPQQQIGDTKAAAKAAGCKLASPEIEGAGHETREFTAADYKTNPPTSGNHFPQWYEDGIYEPGNAPELGKLVHTLEHGRINLQYKEGTPRETVLQLEALFSESDGYHMLLYQNTTGMDAQVAATAWGQSLTCPRMSDAVFDAIRTFRASYIDKGPEAVP